jgi:hypothetical protein
VTVRTYATPAAYKTALETRVAAEAKRRALPINRVRQLLVTERLLVRILAHFGERVVAKGGLVLELRLNRARTTKDPDLRLTGDAKQLLAQVRAACAIATGDLLEYTVEPDADHRKPFTNDVRDGIALGTASWQAAGCRGPRRAAQPTRARVAGGIGNASGSPT